MAAHEPFLITNKMNEAPPSPRPISEYDHADGFHQDAEVQRQGHVLDVVQVVFQLGAGILDGGPVGEIDLRPARDAGPDGMPDGIVGHLGRQVPDELGPFGSRADEAHFPSEHVDQLRQLVDAELPDPLPDPGGPGIVLTGPDRSGQLGVVRHGTEFPQREDGPVLSDPLLPEEHRPRRIKLDGRGGRKKNGQGRKDERRRHREIDQPLDVLQKIAVKQVESRREDEPFVPDVVNGHAAGELFVDLAHVHDLNPVETVGHEALEQPGRSVFHGVDGRVHAVPEGDFIQAQRMAQHLSAADRFAVRAFVVIQKTDDPVRGKGGVEHPA